MEKELTPIQQAIEKLKEKMEILSVNLVGKSIVTTELYRTSINSYKDCIKTLTDLLPKEQAAIEEAYKNGYLCNSWHETPTEYYTNKYKGNGI